MKNQKVMQLFLTSLLVMLVFGCGPSKYDSEIRPTPPTVTRSAQEPSEYLIHPGDELEVKFFYNPELNELVVVRPDGKISLQLLDEIQAAGMTPSQLNRRLTEEYSRELKKPSVTVIVRTFTGQRVYVGGEVGVPGLIDYVPGMDALQAVVNAGGFIPSSKPQETIIIRKGPDGRPIPIRVNLRDILYGEHDLAALQPSDIVYVPKSAIAKANQFVNQYVENLLLFRGVSLGFSYLLNPDDDRR
jgi:polysaccharide biosynthesis/export protein